MFEDTVAFKQVIEAPLPILKPFEESTLTKFYSDVANEIRKYDKQGILLLETNYFSNLGTPSMINAVSDKKGNRDKFQAYARHAYDLVIDTDLEHTANDR